MDTPLEAETHVANVDPYEIDEAIAESVSDEVRALINRCMDGTEPLERPLRPQEAAKLSPRAIQALFLRVAGFKGKEVAEYMGLTESYVSIMFSHPYSRKIVRAIIGSKAGEVTDIRTRLEYHSALLLERVATMAATEDDIAKVTTVTFGLLDRAGYGAKQKIEVDSRRTSVNMNLDAGTAHRLATALDESVAIEAKVMPSYVPKPPPDQQFSTGETVDDRAISVLRKLA